MTRQRIWKIWRTAAVSVSSGAAGLFLAGCQAVDSEPESPVSYQQVLYPGLPPVKMASRTVRSIKTDTHAPFEVVTASANVRRKSTNQVHTADAVVPVKGRSGPTITEIRQTQAEADAEAKVPTPAPNSETIDLGVALRLAGVSNPTANLARERIREALANQLAARSLLLPTVIVGGNYRYHSGRLQDVPGEVRNVRLHGSYLGLGAGAIGTNPVAIPGVRLFAHLGDAVYEPLAARQRVIASRSDAHAIQNQILLSVTISYLQLVEAEASLYILRRSEAEIQELARVTAEFARTGQGAPPDANRAEARLEMVRRQIRWAEGTVAAMSARLCGLLNLDPSVQLRTPGGPVEVFRLIPEDQDVESLIATALLLRPEMPARSAAIQEAQTRVRQERARPMLPTLSVGYSAGQMGGGGTLGNFTSPNVTSGRSDFDVFAVWSVQNLWMGNLSRVRTAKARVGVAVAGYDAMLNQVRQEVASAQADAQAANRQIDTAKIALAEAENGYMLESERVRRGEGRPIEALDSFRQLLDARLELLRAMIAFDMAQIRLYVAIGSDPLAGPAAQPAQGVAAPAPRGIQFGVVDIVEPSKNNAP